MHLEKIQIHLLLFEERVFIVELKPNYIHLFSNAVKSQKVSSLFIHLKKEISRELRTHFD